MAALGGQQLLPAPDELVRQFVKVAGEIVSAAVPAENFSNLLSKDLRYDRALRGLRLLARSHNVLLVDTLIKWRHNINEDIKRAVPNDRDRVLAQCKRSVSEVLFLEAALQVLEECTEQSFARQEFCNFYEKIHQLAFGGLVSADDIIPYNELTSLRQVVLNSCAHILGTMSRVRLRHLSDVYLRHLAERINPKRDPSKAKEDWTALRNQIARLAHGLRYVELQFATDTQLLDSASFLRRAHPLLHTAPNKKSQIHHSLCEMMTMVLTPLVRENMPLLIAGRPLELRREWAAAVEQMRQDVWAWMNKHVKHVQVGYPLYTVLVCVSDNEKYLSVLDSTMDFLHKRMKEREYRSLCIRCLSQLALAYLVRVAPAAGRPAAFQCLNKLLKPVLLQIKKGFASVPLQDVLDMVTLLLDAAPEYIISGVILELLASDVSDCILAGLRSLHLLATHVPPAPGSEEGAQGLASGSGAAGVRGAASMSPAAAAAKVANTPGPGGSNLDVREQVMEVLHTGMHPFELLGVASQLPRVQTLLSRLMAAAHGLHGNSRDTAVTGSPEKQQAVAIFAWVLRLIPYTKPEQWPGPGVRPLDLLPGYTSHVERELRLAATDSLMVILRGLPHLRGSVVAAFSAFTTSIQDDNTVTLRDALAWLQNFMENWVVALHKRCEGELVEFTPAGDAEAPAMALRLDVHRLEGVAVAALCNADEVVRREALQELKSPHLRDLVPKAAQLLSEDGRLELNPWGPARPAELGLPAQHGDTILRLARQLHHAVLHATPYHAAVVGATVPAAAGSKEAVDAAMARLQSGLFAVRATTREEEDAGDLTYVIEVVEQAGPDIVRRCYWDFGDFADLVREYQAVPDDANFELVVSHGNSNEVSRLRLTRCLAELVATVAHMCPASAAAIQVEVMVKLAKLLTKDAIGRVVLPLDGLDGRRLDVWRNLSSVACVLPLSLYSQQSGPKRPLALALRDLVKVHLLLLSVPPIPGVQAASCQALGQLNTEALDVLVDELQPILDEYNRAGKGVRGGSGGSGGAKGRPEDVRRWVAHLFRILAETVSADVLGAHPGLQRRFLDFIRDSYAQLRPLGVHTDAFWEISQGAGGLGDAHSSNGSLLLRKLLFELFFSWTSEAPDFSILANSGMTALLLRYKDPESIGAGRLELLKTCSALEHAARLGMAAMLVGPVFDTDVKRPQGPVLTWVGRLFAPSKAQADSISGTVPQPGPSRSEVASLALLNLVESTPDLLRTCVVDQCYNSELQVARGYFQVLSEVYTTRPAACEVHVLLSLVLYKMVDLQQDVREDALSVYNVLSERELQVKEPQHEAGLAKQSMAGAAGSDAGLSPRDGATCTTAAEGESAIIVVGNLQDCCQRFQLQMSAKLARDHPQLSELLCIEMLTRQVECREVAVQHPVLTCLGPWIDNLAIDPHWKGNWCERLLKSLYYVTLYHGDQFPVEVEHLWKTLGSKRRNIIPVLDFLVTLGVEQALQETVLEFFSVGKRIGLYVSRASPQQTIDHLAYEMNQLLLEDDRLPVLDEASPVFEPSDKEADAEGTLNKISVASSSQADATRSSHIGSEMLQGRGTDGGTSSRSLKDARSLDISRRSNSNSSMGSTSMAGGGASGIGHGGGHGGGGSGNLASQSMTDSALGAQGLVSASKASSWRQPDDGNGLPMAGPSSTGDRQVERHGGGSSGAGIPVAGGRAISASRPSAGRRTSCSMRPMLARPELSLCLLAEVAYEHDQDLRTHLALLFHIITICMDHEEPLVAAHAQQLLINLLYNVSATHMEAAQEIGEVANIDQVTSLMRYLQTQRGQRLWAHQDYRLHSTWPLASETSLAGLVSAMIEAMHFEHDLRSTWYEVALDWALHCRSRHLSCRSIQVFRALFPPLTAEICATLLAALQHCFLAHSMVSREVTVEVVITLRVLIERLAPGRLMIYPQLFWACLALLHTPHVQVFDHALQLLITVAGGLKLHQAKVQAVLLACAPGAQGRIILQASAPQESPDNADTWLIGLYMLGLMEEALPKHQSLAVQQMILKGLSFAETQLNSVRALALLADVLAVQGEASMGMSGLAKSQPPTPRGAVPSADSPEASPCSPKGPGGNRSSDQVSHRRSGLHRSSFVSSPEATVAPAERRTSAGADGGRTVRASAPSWTALDTGGLTAGAQAFGGPRASWPMDSALSAAAAFAAAQHQHQRSASIAEEQPLDGEGDSEGDGDSDMAGGGPGGGRTTVVRGVAPLLRGATHFESLRKHRALKLDSYQTLLGPWQSQLFISILGLVPFHVAYHAKEGTIMRSTALTDALTHCLFTLARAALYHGLPDLATALETLTGWRALRDTDALELAISRLCIQLNRGFFPKYSRWFLYHCVDLLKGPVGGRLWRTRMAPSVLLLLRCMFKVDGLRFGPAAALLLEGGLLAPLSAMAKGALSQPALEAIAAMIAFAQRASIPLDGLSSRDSLDGRDQVERAEPLRVATGVGGGSPATGGGGAVLARTLHPPAVSVANSLRKVLDTMGTSIRRRRVTRLMPFLGSHKEEGAGEMLSSGRRG